MISTKADALFQLINKEERLIACEILKALHGLELSRAIWVLNFCKEAVSDTAVVTTK